MRALTRKVFRDITHRKVRTLLTILGVAIGIIGLSAINIASSEFKASLEYATSVTAQPDIQIYTQPTSASTTDIIARQPNVKTVQARGNVLTRWAIGDEHKLLQILGIQDFQQIKIGKFDLIEGSLPGKDEIALEAGARSFTDVQVGDTISIQVGSAYHDFRVSGIVLTQGRALASIDNKAWGYMNEQDVENWFNRPGVTNFVLQLDNYEQRFQTYGQIAQVLAANQVEIKDSDIGRDHSVQDIADGLFGIMGVLSIIAIILSAILLVGTITSLLTEQIKAIGTMKAIGGRQGQIIRHYLTLVFVYAVTGTALGIVVGVFSGHYLATYLGGLVSLRIGSLTIEPMQVVEALLVGIGIPLLAALLPTYIGTRITVRQALSGYGLENTSSNSGRGLSRFLFMAFPQTIQFGVRNVFRKRLRSILTMVTLATAGAALLAVLTASYSFNTFLGQVYTVYHFDVKVGIANAQTLQTFKDILTPVSGVGHIEGFSQTMVETEWGNATLTGVQPDTQIYRQDVTAGRWLTSNDHNSVLISKDAAEKSGLKVGDSIRFTYGARNVDWQIIGITVDYSGIGPGNLGVLVTSVGEMNALDGAPADQFNQVLIQSSNQAATAADLHSLARRVDDAMSAAGYLPNVSTAQEQIEQAQNKYQVVFTMLDIVAIIIAIVGAVGLSNSLTMSVLERRREIGILRSIGAVGRKVGLVFWSEGTALGIFAWLLALVLAVPAAYGFMQVQAQLLAPVPFAFDPMNLVWMLVVVVVVAMLASVGPVFAAMRVKIIQTLRYE